MFLLFILSGCVSCNNLRKPFYPDINDNIGSWSFSGSVMVMQDMIMLTPPIQNKFGCAWNKAEIPGGNWSIQADFKISKGTGGGGFALWLIDKYGYYGNLHGGPEMFKGVVVSATISEVLENNTHQILFHVVENNGDKIINLTTIVPDYVMQFHHRFVIPIDIEFNKDELIVRSDGNNNNDLNIVCRKRISVNLKNSYLGITAASEEMTSRIDLLNVEFDKEYNTKMRNVYVDKKHISGNLPNKRLSSLRNPMFSEVLNEINDLRDGKLNKESTFENVINVMDELNRVSYGVASFRDLNNFILTSIMPYSKKWHKRTIKIVENVKKARDVMGSAWNYSQTLLTSFNSSLVKSLLKTNTNIMTLSEELLGLSDDSSDSNTIVINLSDEQLSPDMVIAYFIMFESLCAMIYIISLRKGSF